MSKIFSEVVKLGDKVLYENRPVIIVEIDDLTQHIYGKFLQIEDWEWWYGEDWHDIVDDYDPDPVIDFSFEEASAVLKLLEYKPLKEYM